MLVATQTRNSDAVLHELSNEISRSWIEKVSKSLQLIHRVHCFPSSSTFRIFSFRYTSFSTFFPNCSFRFSLPLSFPLCRTTARAGASPCWSGSLSLSVSASKPWRFLFPLLGCSPMFTLTLGGTENPNALPTFVRSSFLTSNIFLREYDA